MAAQVLVPYSSCFLTDLQASSALAEASAQRRLRNCRRCAAASSSVRLQLRSLSTSRSADRLLSSMRPDWKHMVASETQEGSQQSGLPHARHHSSGLRLHAAVMLCVPLSSFIYRHRAASCFFIFSHCCITSAPVH